MRERRPCQRDGCDQPARYAPKLFVPATGGPQSESKAACVIIGLCVCVDHRDGLKDLQFIEELLGPELRNAIRAMIGTWSWIPPDFSRAWVRPIRCDSPEFREFEQQQAAGKTRQ